MAACIEAAQHASAPQLVDLRRLSSADLDALLEEEIANWERLLDWDFTKSADLVRRFVDMRALNGSALLLNGSVAGYSYYVYEEHKGLVGDLYVMDAHRTADLENRLLSSVLDGLIGAPHVKRIESQLMMVEPAVIRALPHARFSGAYERDFMVLDSKSAPRLAAAKHRRRIFSEKWSEHFHDAAAKLIADAYQGHVDSLINDQYRSVGGARRFLFNIVQYPGCGTFFRPASFAAFDRDTGRICGICLASLVSPKVGHITQICVSPDVRGTGIGYELLRNSLQIFEKFGCRAVSLTVTSSNREAIRLYENVGFRTRRQFTAYVWEGF